jgi:hypothetical protein
MGFEKVGQKKGCRTLYGILLQMQHLHAIAFNSKRCTHAANKFYLYASSAAQ